MHRFDCQQGKTKNCWRSVDAHLNGILTTIWCSTIVPKMDTVIIDSQCIVSMYYHVNPYRSMPLSFRATTIQVFWTKNDVGTPRFSAFRQQFTAYWSIQQFLRYIAWLPYLSWSSSFSSISMTYQKQFSKSGPCAPGLSRELCSWMHGWM